MKQSSLRQYDRPADRIRLHRQDRSTPVIVVEGVIDKRFCQQLLRSHAIDFFIVGTRDVVLDVVSELRQLQVDDVVGVVDRDFDEKVASFEAEDLPILAYDNGDLEAMLVMSPTLDRFLAEFASDQKLSKFGGVRKVRETAVKLVLPLARLRYANAKHGWGIRFDELDLADRIKRDIPKEMPLNSLCDALVSRSPDSIATRSEMMSAMQGEDPICPYTNRPRIRGRDALAVVGVMLRKQIGSLSSGETSVDQLEMVIRLTAGAYEVADTSWWLRLCARLGLSPN